MIGKEEVHLDVIRFGAVSAQSFIHELSFFGRGQIITLERRLNIHPGPGL